MVTDGSHICEHRITQRLVESLCHIPAINRKLYVNYIQIRKREKEVESVSPRLESGLTLFCVDQQNVVGAMESNSESKPQEDLHACTWPLHPLPCEGTSLG